MRQLRNRRRRWLVLAGAIALAAAAFGIDPQRPRDAWITVKVASLLLWEDLGAIHRVSVDTIRGHVTLHGIVGSEGMARLSADRAAETSGVATVQNLLQAVAPEDRAAVRARDAELERRVRAALAHDPLVAGSAIRPASVNAGVVLLEGKAKSQIEHWRALRATSRVPGLRAVASEIEAPPLLGVPEDEMADVRITLVSKLRLFANHETPGFAIDVDAHHGLVVLYGIVGSERARSEASAEVLRVQGVWGVINALQLVPAADEEVVEASDRATQLALEKRFRDEALLRTGDEVDIDVKKGLARLRGDAKDRREKLHALLVASATPGVHSVLDEIRIAPDRD